MLQDRDVFNEVTSDPQMFVWSLRDVSSAGPDGHPEEPAAAVSARGDCEAQSTTGCM